MFPFDFDIFLRSGSRIQPLIVACRHGTVPCSNWLRSTVENNHVRMISGPCGRNAIGNAISNKSESTPQPQTICGVSDAVAQVSITSGSPMKPPACPRAAAAYPGGMAVCGSTGNDAGSARIGLSHKTEPFSSSGYHNGKGTPK